VNPYLIHPATILDRRQEAEGIYSFRLRLTDPEAQSRFRFTPGQFNMLYLFGVGEVAISLVSDPDVRDSFAHTVRTAGRVTTSLVHLEPGETFGVRGPFGQGWPMELARGKDLLFVTGGLGCAPVAGAIDYVFRRREDYGAVKILHGVKHPHDLLYRDRFEAWRAHPNTEVYLASDQPAKAWRYHVGVVTDLFEDVRFDPDRTVAMMCGPEIMMRLASRTLIRRGIPSTAVYVSLERHMECGIGLCGHCQLGPFFICKDGPVMRYDRVMRFLGLPGV
jgi:sulfhydrogenase subunit gamma (sulfur reductase)